MPPGAHVTSVGHNPQGREVDDAVAESLVVVDSSAPQPDAVDAATPLRLYIVRAKRPAVRNMKAL